MVSRIIFIIRRFIELAIIVAGYYYTVVWMTGRDKIDDFSREGDLEKRAFDIHFVWGIWTAFIIGYYISLLAVMVYRKRFTDTHTDIKSNNLSVVILRATGLVFMLMAAALMVMVAINPSDQVTAGMIMAIFPVMLCIGPYYFFYKLTPIFTLGGCLLSFVIFVAVVVIAGKLHIPPAFGYLISTLPIFAGFKKRYAQAYAFLKTGQQPDKQVAH